MLREATMWFHIRAMGFGRTPAAAETGNSAKNGAEAVARRERKSRVFSDARPLARALPVLVLGALGCEGLYSPNDTAVSVGLALGTGGTTSVQAALPQGEEWKCLADPEAPAMPQKQTYNFTGVVVDYQSHMPVSATMRACQGTDFDCVKGIADGAQIPPLMPNGPPAMTIQLPTGFTDGLLRITVPPGDVYFPYDYYIKGPITRDVIATQPFPLVTASAFADFVTGLGADPMVAGQLGTLGVQIYDCNQDPAKGVSLVILNDPSTVEGKIAWAQAGAVPVATTETDESGLTGFINLPGINLNVEAVVQGYHFGQRSFRVRPGRLTTGAIRALGYANAY
jgi:hypothetical protein